MNDESYPGIVPDSPSELGFQFESWRPNQPREIDELYHLLEDHWIVGYEAPTGAGKSLVGLSVAKLFGSPVHVVTYTKQLQQQYKRDYGIPVIVGSNNFRCEKHPEFSCKDCGSQFYCWNSQCKKSMDSPCRFPGDCCPRCPYEDQFRRNKGAEVIAFNYALEYSLEVYAPSKLERYNLHPELEIYDEAHMIRHAILDLAGIELPSWLFPEHLRVNAEISYQLYLKYRGELERILDLASAKLGDAIRNQDPKQFKKWKYIWDQTTRLKQELDVGWCCISAQGKIYFSPVWIQERASKLFKSDRKYLLMSATFLDHKLYFELLGLDPEIIPVVKGESMLDYSRRPIGVIPIQKVDVNTQEYTRLIQGIDKILQTHANHKGIIHTVSFSLAKKIYSESKFRNRMVMHDEKNREEIIEKFRREESNLVLISPSSESGLDVPDCHFIIWAKVPFGDLGDVVQNKIFRERKEVYWYDAAFRLIQGSGRGLRDPGGWCAVYILDSHAKWFLIQNRKLFPDWFWSCLKFYNVREEAS